MKTRILAIVLVCVMVVSMLPATAFAATTTIPACPGGDAKEHDLSNCASAQFIKKVEATDCTDGYELYKCGVCGAEFADKITPAKHDWVAQADVAPTCSAKGKDNYYICSKCDKEKYDELAIDPNNHSYKPVDKWTAVQIPGFAAGEADTEQRVLECEWCKKAWKLMSYEDCECYDDTKMEHTWNNPDLIKIEIVKEPTDAADGEAVFTCKNCAYSETVRIHNHKLKYQPAVAATCTEIGYDRAFYTCTICNLNFWTTAATDADKDGIYTYDATHGTPADAELWITIPAAAFEANKIAAKDHKHTNGSSALLEYKTQNEVEMNCDPDVWTDGSIEKWCTLCEDWVKVVTPVAHDYVYAYNHKPTCFHDGYDVYICQECGKADPLKTNLVKFTPDSNHKTTLKAAQVNAFKKFFITEELWNVYKSEIKYSTWDFVATWTDDNGTPADTSDDVVYNSVLPTCNQNGVLWVKCDECAEYHDIKLNKLGHDLKKVTIPATCTTWSIEYEYCTHCVTYGTAWITQGRVMDEACGLNDTTATNGLISVTQGEGANAVTQNIPAYYGSAKGDGYVYTEVTYVGADTLTHKKYTATPDTTTFKYYGDSVKVVGGTDSSKHITNTWITDERTCEQDGRYTVLCTLCGWDNDAKLVVEPAYGHDWNDTNDTTLPATKRNDTYAIATCQRPGYIDVTCKTCGVWYSASADAKDAAEKAMGKQVTEGVQVDDPSYMYLTKDAAEIVHDLSNTFVYHAGDCEKIGYWEYFCTSCQKNVVIKDTTTGYHIGPNGAHYDATEPNADEVGVYHKAACQTGAYWETWTCTRPNCAYGENGGAYVRPQITDTKNPALGPNYVKTDAGRPLTCTQTGIYPTYTCNRTNCDCTNPVDTNKYDAAGKIDDVNGIENRSGKVYGTPYHDVPETFIYKALVEASCTADGELAHWECSVCKKVFEIQTGTADPTEIDLGVALIETTHAALKLNKTGHDYELIVERDQNCVYFGYAFFNCKNCANKIECDDQYITGYGAAMSDAHAHDNGGKPRIEAESQDAECKAPGFDKYLCVVCGDKFEVKTTTPHMNKDGEILEDKCSNTVADRDCVKGCGQTIGQTHEDPDFKYCTSEAQKKLEYKYVDATCNNIGYWINYCSVCEAEEIITNEILDPAKGHNFVFDADTVYPTASDAANPNQPGYHVCTRCYAVEYFKGVEYRIVVENADNAKYTNYTDASSVKVSVYVRGLGIPDVLSLGFTIAHSENVEFVSGKGVDADFSLGHVSADVNTPNTVKGIYYGYDQHLMKTKEVALSDEIKLAELTFQIRAFDAAHNKVDAFDNNEFWFAVVDAVSTDEPDAQGNVTNYWTLHAYSAGIQNPDKSEKVNDYQYLGDINKDGVFDAMDTILATSVQMNNPTYLDACVDVDRDGEFSFEDLNRLYGYYTGDANDVYNKLVDYIVVTP